MTENDLHERLEDMGYGADSNLTRFHYYLLPALPPLDTREGGAAALEIATRHSADLVIVDTASRVLSGEENSADTLRSLYLHTGLPLKAQGINVWRQDHAGKDLRRGQRGTSAKADDVDLVWELSARDNGFRLKATHRRQSWVPEVVDLVRLDDPLRFERAAEISWPPGTREAAALLDQLKIPLGVTVRDAQAKLRSQGKGLRRDVIGAAVRWRRRPGTITRTIGADDAGTDRGNHPDDGLGNRSGNLREPHATGIGNRVPPLRGEPVPPASAEPSSTEFYGGHGGAPCSRTA
jgi:hypothetical protein